MYCLFSSLHEEMIQFDEHIFQMGWFNHQLEICCRMILPVCCWNMLSEGPQKMFVLYEKIFEDGLL